MKNNSIPHVPIKGLVARVAIQCLCPDTGVEGYFLFSGESHRSKHSRVTPVYDDLAELFPAVKAAGWVQIATGDCAHGYIFSPR